jgi:DNA-binding NarL/FixJ family response regulator
VLDERARIARELHDIIAHSVSVMTVQVGAVRRRLTADQTREHESLVSVERTGREALAEMRRLVGLLHEQEEEANPSYTPQPGLQALDTLISGVRAAGLPVDLHEEGTRHELPPGVDLAAYRVVQEALTNTLKYAGPAQAWVQICWTPDELRIEVANNGLSTASARGTARPGCASASGCTAAGSRAGRGRTAATSSAPSCRSGRRNERAHPGPDRRRPADGAGRPADDPRARARPRHRGRGGRRQRGVAVAAATEPDVILMDVRMPNLDGLEATRRIVGSREDGPRVLILTTFDLDVYVYEALASGASGFVLKDIEPEKLVDAIRVIANGEALLSPTVTKKLIEEFVRRPPDVVHPSPRELEQLTAREAEIMALVARGLSNAEIAAQAFVSEPTVKTHVARILMKLGLRDRVQVVVYAYEHGLAKPGS